MLADIAVRVGTSYPELFRHQTVGVAFLLSRRKAILADDMGLGKTRTAIVAAREENPDGPFLVICPATVKLNWRREIQLVEPDADVHVVGKGSSFEAGHRWTVVNYDLVSRNREQLKSVDWAVVIVDEAHYIKNDSVRSRRTLELLGVAGKQAVGGPACGLPADRHADGQPPARPVQPAQSGPASAGDELLRLRQALLRSVRQRLRPRLERRVEPRRARHDPVGRDAAAHQVRGARPAGEGALVGSRRGPDRPRPWRRDSVPSTTSPRNPARSGATWVTFLGMLNKARHALAVAKAPATADFVTDCVEAGQKVVVFTSYTAVVETLRERFGDACVTLTGADDADGRDAAVDRFQTDDTVRVFVGNLHAAGRRHHPDRRHPRRVQRPRLGARQPLAGRGPDPPHRPERSSTFATYLHAAGTLDDYVAALLEQKAAVIATLEDTAQDHATLLERRGRPGARRRRRRAPTPRPLPARRWGCSTRPSTCSNGSSPNNSPCTAARTSSSSPARPLRASCTTCVSPTASPCATAPASATAATASTAGR